MGKWSVKGYAVKDKGSVNESGVFFKVQWRVTKVS